MNGNLLLTALFILPTIARADTEFEDSIPLDLAKILLNFGNATDVGIYSDILENFPEFALPDGFEVLGSLDQGLMRRVVLQTNMEAEQAQNLLLATLVNEGWQELQRPDTAAIQPRGFVPAGRTSPERIPPNVCHDEHGIMTVNAVAAVNGSIVSLLQNNNSLMQETLNCALHNQQTARSFGMQRYMIGGVREHMPTLQMPEPTSNPTAPRMAFLSGSGSSGSSNDVETRSHVSSDESIDSLYAFFAEQLVEQGWTEETPWTGSITAGGSWTKSPGEDLDLTAILSIVETTEDNYELKLRLLSRGPR